jgi:hypothetical protein
MSRPLKSSPAIDLTTYASLSQAQRDILNRADSVSRPILLNLFKRAREITLNPSQI